MGSLPAEAAKAVVEGDEAALLSWLESGGRVKHYYVNESVGLACGMLLAALHQAGLATLTHTPSPMAFLREEKVSRNGTTKKRKNRETG